MRRVRKGAEPACLDAARREVARIEGASRAALEAAGAQNPAEDSTLEDRWAEVKGECKAALREALYRDQDGLCAYCGGRLKLDTMKIEHMHPRAADRERILDWSNLLGCCPGRYPHQGDAVLHCDSSRSPYSAGPPPRGLLHTHPVTSPVAPERLFAVKVTGGSAELGVIQATTPEAERDLSELNLNAPRLVENRAEAINDLRVELRAAGRRSDAQLRRLLRTRLASATTSTGQPLESYAHVIAAYLFRKLHQHGLSA